MNIPSRKIKGELRRTQIITTMGPGAIVDLKNASVIISGIDKWFDEEDKEKIEESKFYNIRLQKMLGMDYFLMPPHAMNKNKKNNNYTYDILAYRFPKWYYCDACKKLAPYQEFEIENGRLLCSCKGFKKEVIPSRFVVACEKGHISDFPYREWAHGGPTTCNKPLKILSDKQTGELKSIHIKCECGKSNHMGNTFSKTFEWPCSGEKPWLGDVKEDCTQNVTTLQRSSTSVYFPITLTSILIPPWSKEINNEIERNWEVIEIAKEPFLKLFSKKYDITEEEVERQIELVKNEKEGEELTFEDLIQDEYRALKNKNNDENFVTDAEPVPEFMKKYIKQIVLVKKLTETIVQVGFKRVNPEYELNEEKTYTRLSGKIGQNWLPGVVQKGEGIFIEWNEEAIKQWEENPKIQERYKKIIERKEEGYIKSLRKSCTPRTILLHTISHSLIRELTFACGYSTTSLKERIYSSYEGENAIPMAGTLIYTSSGDSDGSLGGLVRQGKTKNMEQILKKAIESVAWCSSDPLCSQTEGSGYKNLNLAACHACLLLPETSCELRNVLLDRASIRGTLEDVEIGFLKEFYQNEIRE